MSQATLKILIIEDDDVDRMELVRTIKKSELACDIIEKINLEDAMAICSQMSFDCVIIDYRLPGQDGLAGIRILNSRFPNMAIIMSTGQGNEEVATEALKCGALDYIVKCNVSPALLKKSITSAIKKALLKKQRQAKEAINEYLALHDPLTDIPNRMLFNFILKREIEHAKRHKQLFALLFLDLDRFKNINDSLGHAAGDSLLQQISKRFKSIIREEDLLARLGGDEFGILMSSLSNAEDAKMLATKLIDSLKNSFILEGEEIHITTSIGIAIYPVSGETASEIMHNADSAMYQAKHGGRNTFKLSC